MLKNVYTLAYNKRVNFDWDESKNRSNFKKHEIWFEEALTLWCDSTAIEFFDPEHSEKEDRFIRVGRSDKNRFLLVIFCDRAEESVIRIISARKATSQEVKTYEEGI